MADELRRAALVRIEPKLRFYLAAVVDLLNCRPDEKETFMLIAQRRQTTLTRTLDDARGEYEVLLPDQEVIRYGLSCLSQVHAAQLSASVTLAQVPGSSEFKRHLELTLEAIIGEANLLTLNGLTAFAKNYQRSSS